MANYQTLKGVIDANIRNNGNGEITGNILNGVLNSMVTTLGNGYVFAGEATPAINPGTPDNNVYYVTTTPGNYVNFGGINVVENELAFLTYNGSWQKISYTIGSGGISESIVLREIYVGENLTTQQKELNLESVAMLKSGTALLYMNQPISVLLVVWQDSQSSVMLGAYFPIDKLYFLTISVDSEGNAVLSQLPIGQDVRQLFALGPGLSTDILNELVNLYNNRFDETYYPLPIVFDAMSSKASVAITADISDTEISVLYTKNGWQLYERIYNVSTRQQTESLIDGYVLFIAGGTTSDKTTYNKRFVERFYDIAQNPIRVRAVEAITNTNVTGYDVLTMTAHFTNNAIDYVIISILKDDAIKKYRVMADTGDIIEHTA